MAKRLSYQVIHVDDDILIINKPPGLLTLPDRYDVTKQNLLNQLQSDYGDIFVVHRLDRDTSGVMIFAKHAEAHRVLSRQFEQKQTEKYYLALVKGHIIQDEFTIDKPIAPHPTESGKMVIHKSGKTAVSQAIVKHRFKGYTLLEVQILTGRMHQIRVHLQSHGFPLAIDPMYGGDAAFMVSAIKGRKYKLGKWIEAETPIMDRVTLHAQRLQIHHPSTAAQVAYEAELPKDFGAVLKQLHKWAEI